MEHVLDIDLSQPTARPKFFFPSTAVTQAAVKKLACATKEQKRR